MCSNAFNTSTTTKSPSWQTVYSFEHHIERLAILYRKATQVRPNAEEASVAGNLRLRVQYPTKKKRLQGTLHCDHKGEGGGGGYKNARTDTVGRKEHSEQVSNTNHFVESKKKPHLIFITYRYISQ
jgi:hypothetical protein